MQTLTLAISDYAESKINALLAEIEQHAPGHTSKHTKDAILSNCLIDGLAWRVERIKAAERAVPKTRISEPV